MSVQKPTLDEVVPDHHRHWADESIDEEEAA